MPELQGPASLYKHMERTAFDDENVVRNMNLAKTCAMPKALKTGTTIVGLIYKDGVVLGADTRATSGSTVADKNCDKLHRISENIFCAGAGTAADTEMVTKMTCANMALLSYRIGRKPRVAAAKATLKGHLFRYQGAISAALILGGCDVKGPQLVTISPGGSTHDLPFCTMGSGSLAAMSIFEAEYKADMTEEEAVLLARRSIERGVDEDEGSGFNVDIRIIRMDGTTEGLRGCNDPSGNCGRPQA